MFIRQRIISQARRLLALRRSPFAQNLAVYGSSASLAQGMMMVYALVLARVLGPAAYGVYAGAYVAAGLSSFLMNWGMDTWMLREGAGKSSTPRLAAAILRTKTAYGLLWGAALIGVFPLVRGDLFSPLLIAIVVVDVWADSCFNTLIAALNIQRRLTAASRLMLLSRGGRLVGALTLIALKSVAVFPLAASPQVFAGARAFFTLAGVGAALWVTRPQVLRRPDFPERKIMRRSLPFGFSDFLALVYMQADVFLLTLFAPKSAIGVYSAAVSLVNALFVIPNAGYFVSIPLLSRLVDHNRAEFRNVTRRIMRGFALLGVGMTLGMALVVSWLIPLLLGSSYQTTSGLVRLLSPILFLKCLEFGWAAILIAVGWQKNRLGPQIISALVNVLVNLWAIPRFGVYGVATVYVVSEMFLAAGYGWLVWKWLRTEGHVDGIQQA